MQGHNKKIITIIKHRYPEIKAIYYFGSYGTKYERAHSDIDIALLCKSKIDPLDRWELAQEIAIAIDRDVDLVDLLDVPIATQREIITTGTRVYCVDSQKIDLFEEVVHEKYRDLEERRRGIVNDAKKRGSVL